QENARAERAHQTLGKRRAPTMTVSGVHAWSRHRERRYAVVGGGPCRVAAGAGLSFAWAPPPGAGTMLSSVVAAEVPLLRRDAGPRKKRAWGAFAGVERRQ